MVDTPRLAENFSFVIGLASQVFAQLPQSVLEFLLEVIQHIVDVAHSVSCLLLVLLNLAARQGQPR